VGLTSDGPSRLETTPGVAPSHGHVLSAAQGWGFLVGGRVIEFGSRFLVALLLAHLLGARDFGLYVLAISAVTLVAGVSLLGLDQAVVRYVAILSSRGDRAGVWGTIQIGLGIGAVVGAAMGGVLYLGSSAIAVGFFDEPRLTPLLQVLAVVVPFLVISEVLAATARGFRRMDYVAFADTAVQSVVRIGLLGTLALIGQLDVLSAAIAFGISDVASTIALIILLNRLFPLRKAAQEGGRRDVKPIVGFALPLWLSELIFHFRKNVLTITLGTLSTVASVGIFTVASRVSSVGHMILVSLESAIRPILAQLHDRADRAGLAHLYTTATRWMLTLNLPFFLLIVLYSKVLLSLFGETFRAGAAALLILGAGELVNAATGICGPMIDMTGHVKLKLVNSILRIVVLVAASAVLIPIWGVIGAATAALLSITVVNAAAILELWILEGLIPFERRVWKPLTAAVAALLVGFGLRSAFPIGGDLLNAVLQGGIVLGVYAGMIVVLGLAPEDRLVLDKTRRKVQRFIRRTPAEPDAAAG
jgi:O-antigen/teichoic acid export membrane protein